MGLGNIALPKGVHELMDEVRQHLPNFVTGIHAVLDELRETNALLREQNEKLDALLSPRQLSPEAEAQRYRRSFNGKRLSPEEREAVRRIAGQHD